MKRTAIFLSLFLGPLFLVSGVLAANSAAPAAEIADTSAGRAAFIEMKCTSCHKVLGDISLPAMTASEAAPVLGGLNAVHTEDELTLAIIRPSHTFAPGFHASESGASRMGDMGDTMTVRQLRDIVAYLKAQEQKDSVWPQSYQTKPGHQAASEQ